MASADAAAGKSAPTMQSFDMAYYEAHGHLAPNGPPLLGLGAGDSKLIFNVCPPDLASHMFTTMREEVPWNTMSHHGGLVPRLISIQGTIADDCEPVYRHPAEQQPAIIPWTPTTDILRMHVMEAIGQNLNHALVQWYRNGTDFISEHSDKTLDVRRGSFIVNLSLGASRVMILRTKDKTKRIIQRITLPHNSVFVMGWETNRIWTHEIHQDKRMDSLKREDEMRDNSQRISLTFRDIGTFYHRPSGRLFGQGAKCKSLDDPMMSPLDENIEGLMMLKAFSAENKDPNFDWDQFYGPGFDMVNFHITEAAKHPAKAPTAGVPTLVIAAMIAFVAVMLWRARAA